MDKIEMYKSEGREIVNVATPPIVNIPTQLYGEEILTSTDLHPGSCMHFGSKDKDGRVPLVEAYGTCRNLSFSSGQSKVVRTPLSPALEKAGSPCKWGSPPMHVARNHEMVFENAQHPIDSISSHTLKWAKEDYLYDVIGAIRGIGYTTVPLNDHEIYNGRPSEGINAMNMSTSPGVGLSGIKKDHCESVLTPQGTQYYPKPYISEEVSRIRQELCDGKRCCPITKTALKDEPVKLTKQAARLFYVMPMAFIAVCRQVMCPLLAFMMATQSCVNHGSVLRLQLMSGLSAILTSTSFQMGRQ
jgi:hypothetical protein